MSDLDDTIARLEARNARRPRRVLIRSALGCVVVAAIALVLDWHSASGDLGVTARLGYAAAPGIVFVTGVLAVVLLVIADRDGEGRAWPGCAAVVTAVAAIAILVGLAGSGHDGNHSGPAAWIALTAFLAATGTAGLAAVVDNRGAVPINASSADKRVHRALEQVPPE